MVLCAAADACSNQRRESAEAHGAAAETGLKWEKAARRESRRASRPWSAAGARGATMVVDGAPGSRLEGVHER